MTIRATEDLGLISAQANTDQVSMTNLDWKVVSSYSDDYILICIIMMEILGAKLCPQHNLEAHKICTSYGCFQEQDILVCPNCSSKHMSRNCQVIDVQLLNQKVHELMRKKVEFQIQYQQACDSWITQLKKFKIFKEQMLNILNHRQRQLNEICRKIKRSIPYEKDKHLFKKTFNYLYLSTRGSNPNYQLYNKFKDAVEDTIKECKNCIHRLVVNKMDIPVLLKKENQICAVLKKCQEDPIPQIKYTEPVFNGFKKETIKFNKNQEAEVANSKLFRIGDEHFLSYSEHSSIVKWYNCHNMVLPKLLYAGTSVAALTVLGKNLLMANQEGRLFFYDLLNERPTKEYASSNHKSAQIVTLLSVNAETVLTFVSCPNQIVALRFDQEKENLKVLKGIELKNKGLVSALMDEEFVASFEDKTVKIFKVDCIEKEKQYEFDSMIRSICVMDGVNLLCGGQSDTQYLLDRRMGGIVTKFIQGNCLQMKKIYPNSVLMNLGNSLKIFDLRMQKQLIRMGLENNIKHIEVLNSTSFVASGKSLLFYEGV